MEQLPPLEATSFHSEASHNKAKELLAAARDCGSLNRQAAVYVGMEASLPELLAAATEVRAPR